MSNEIAHQTPMYMPVNSLSRARVAHPHRTFFDNRFTRIAAAPKACPAQRCDRSAAPVMLLAAAIVMLGHVARAAAVFPNAAWTHRDPAALGLSAASLDAVAKDLGGRGCIVKDGYVVKTWGAQDRKGDWFSSAKPVLSTLLFFAVHEGRISSVDTRLEELGWGLSQKDRSMTLRHLANMTSGYGRPEVPGAAWAYNDFAIQLYQKTLFDRIFQQDPEQIAHDADRLGSLQFEDGLRFRKANRRLEASVRDFARICLFWMNRGRWGERQLLPVKFFDDFMRPQTPKNLPHTRKAETDDYLGIGTYGGGSDHFTKYGAGIYGFNWWFNETGRLHPVHRTWPGAPEDAIMTIGFRGNSSVMMPGIGAMVVAADADWGRIEAGQAASLMNQRLKQIVAATRSRDDPSTTAPSTTEAPTPKLQNAGQKSPAPIDVEEPSRVEISGQRKKWHTVTLTLRGPVSGETASPNPFLDYRVQGVFQLGQREIRAPGYFAADGHAAHSSADRGDAWRIHFVPDQTGTWKWTVCFRRGRDVAVSDDPEMGQPTAWDGVSGQIDVGPTDKTGRDFRGKGMLQYVGRRYLYFAEHGELFLKGGADSPENFLAFDQFDATTPTHQYEPHAGDFRPSDPTWQNGKGKNILGALNYLAAKDVNSVYFLTMNVKGDGNDVWPWIDPQQRLRYDCSKLDQWNIVFSHMDRLGIMLHVVTQEQENDQLLDKGRLGRERRLYYRELVARFGHHLAVTWNLGEENTNTDRQRKQFARCVRRLDPYNHPIAVHTFPNRYDNLYAPLLGEPFVEGASLQTNDTRQLTQRWIDRSEASGRKWVVCLDEIGPANTGVKPDAVDYGHDDVRKRHLWGHFMAGGAGVEWLFGYRYAHNDLNLEDFRSRDRMWDLTRICRRFMLDHLPLETTRHADQLLQADDAYCLAHPGVVYAVYLPNGGPAAIDFGRMASDFDILWYDPRRGGPLERGTLARVQGPGTVSIGLPPRDQQQDWAALVRRPAPVATHRLIVRQGLGGGAYPAGAAVPIAAIPAPQGPAFDCWQSPSVTFPDIRKPRTVIIMPDSDCAVEGHYGPAGSSSDGDAP